MAADIAVLHHLAALLRVDIELDQLEAIGALHLNGVVHARNIARTGRPWRPVAADVTSGGCPARPTTSSSSITATGTGNSGTGTDSAGTTEANHPRRLVLPAHLPKGWVGAYWRAKQARDVG